MWSVFQRAVYSWGKLLRVKGDVMARLTLFDKNRTCCVDFMKEECEKWEGHCCYCSTNEKVWDKLRAYEEKYEEGKL